MCAAAVGSSRLEVSVLEHGGRVEEEPEEEPAEVLETGGGAA